MLARVSSEPGKTREINFYRVTARPAAGADPGFVEFFLVDLPGYGFARAGKAARAGASAVAEAIYFSPAAITAVHLSRLAEELVLWASQPFGFVRLSDSFSTGSSIMPQKRNPDAAELVRGHSGRILGALTALCVTMKGLPLAYSKDMQDDKEPVFEAHDLLSLSLAAMAGMIETVEFVPERMRAAAEAGHSTATDLADWLVRERNVPFREAHHITGRAVRLADERGVALWELPLDSLREVDARIGEGVFSVLSPDASVKSRKSFGGTAPGQVRKRIEVAKKVLGIET